MLIVIDLQGIQTPNSRNRGIGHYATSLAKAIIRNKGEHEVIIVLNGFFADTLGLIRADFQDILPQSHIRVWHALDPTSNLEAGNGWLRKSAELIRESFLASLRPDVVFVSSLFEGFVDDAVTSVGLFTQSIPTVVSLYDLIPLINRKPYLENPAYEAWYENKLEHLKRADMLLAISESSRQEGIKYLGFPGDRIINVGAAADPQFKCIDISSSTELIVRERYGLLKEFILYTGGIDYRKNIEGLIRAFSLIPIALRKDYQLVVVCSIQSGDCQRLEGLARQQGLGENEVILTDFVPKEDLIALYNLCKTFVFPSWHEGFGLPALEAMCCGAPVIAANTSSLPEVLGCEDALFDPRDDNAIAEKLTQVLSDSVYRDHLISHGLERAKKFSWDECAKVAIAAFEQLHATTLTKINSLPGQRPKLAYISPLPPARSGIADCSAVLLPELARHYQIDVIAAQETITDTWINQNCLIRDIDWFVSQAHRYNRVLYHFGNSQYHQHMFDLLEQIPGVVVLHDFFLSDLIAHLANCYGKIGAWEESLYSNHGYSALIDYITHKDLKLAINTYPCNKKIFDNSQGVIVHSNYSLGLAKQWYGEDAAKDCSVVPLLRADAVRVGRAGARQALDLDDDIFVVASFGMLGPNKLNMRLLEAWLASSLGNDPKCVLVFVGQNDNCDYVQELAKTIRNSGFANRILITGWTEATTFCHYLESADIAVQLRTHSRGETSAAVLDCMNYGLPTIVNANGYMAELSADAVWMMADEFQENDLIIALETLRKDGAKRNTLALKANQVIKDDHQPSVCAAQYIEAIERYYANPHGSQNDLYKAIATIPNAPEGEEYWLSIAKNIAANQPPPVTKQLLLDISGLLQNDSISDGVSDAYSLLQELLIHPPKGFRTELVYGISHDSEYHYARKFVLRLFNYPDHVLADEVVEAFNGDLFLGLNCPPRLTTEQAAFYQWLRNEGVLVDFVEGAWSELPVVLTSKLLEISKPGDQVQVKAEPIISQSIVFEGISTNELISQLGGMLSQSLEASELHLRPSAALNDKPYILSAEQKKRSGHDCLKDALKHRSYADNSIKPEAESILSQSIVFEVMPTAELIDQLAKLLSKAQEAQQLSFNF